MSKNHYIFDQSFTNFTKLKQYMRDNKIFKAVVETVVTGSKTRNNGRWKHTVTVKPKKQK